MVVDKPGEHDGFKIEDFSGERNLASGEWSPAHEWASFWTLLLSQLAWRQRIFQNAFALITINSHLGNPARHNMSLVGTATTALRARVMTQYVPSCRHNTLCSVLWRHDGTVTAQRAIHVVPTRSTTTGGDGGDQRAEPMLDGGEGGWPGRGRRRVMMSTLMTTTLRWCSEGSVAGLYH